MEQALTKIVYVTSSDYKKQENAVFVDHCKLEDGTPVKDRFQFEFRPVAIPETLEVNLEKMVTAEVAKAYCRIRVPCIVEHAGLVFRDYAADSYPGGLTKPMWKALGNRFLEETNSRGRPTIARAVVAYCDGKRILAFTGETTGKLADAPKGSRDFYWDTVFVPDDPTGRAMGKTYAEIADDPILGVRHKMEHLSQSSRAMLSFLKYVQNAPKPDLWR